eukprot:scaffold163779_cov73-Cyclotella_meneghiniana.AAC.1
MTPRLLAFHSCRLRACSYFVRFREEFGRSLRPIVSYGFKCTAHRKLFESNTFQTRASASSLTLLWSNVGKEIQQSSHMVRSIRPTNKTGQRYQLLSFYRFTPIINPESIRDTLFERLKTISGLRGTVYVANEGINAQIAVPVDSLEDLLTSFRKTGENEGACLPFDAFEKEPPNMSDIVDETVPTFDRLIVRTRDYILRDGILSDQDHSPILDWQDNGVELDAKDWDAQLRPILSSTDTDDKVQLVDCRNAYESDQGTFLQSTPLNTQTFSETWSLLDEQVHSNDLDPSKPTYIFCTGGIRCVKVGAYLKQKLGFRDVRSLKHGIIGYERWRNEEQSIRRNEKDGSLWIGENFLFDKRRFANENENGNDEA